MRSGGALSGRAASSFARAGVDSNIADSESNLRSNNFRLQTALAVVKFKPVNQGLMRRIQNLDRKLRADWQKTQLYKAYALAPPAIDQWRAPGCHFALDQSRYPF